MGYTSEQFGPLLAEGATPDSPGVPLAWLPAVVEHMQKEYPPVIARERVAQGLLKMPGLRLFLLVKGRWARPVTPDDLFRMELPVGRRVIRPGINRPSGFTPEPPKYLKTRGAAGLLGWLSNPRIPLDQFNLIAMLASDAAELFGFGVEVKQAPAPAPVVALRLVADTAPAVQSQAEKKAAARAAIQQPERNDKGQVNWSSRDTAQRFLRAYKDLTDAGVKTEDALQSIADLWRSGKGSSLRKKITSCRRLLDVGATGSRSAVG